MDTSKLFRKIPLLDDQVKAYHQYQAVLASQRELARAHALHGKGIDKFLSSRWLVFLGLLAALVGVFAGMQQEHWWPLLVGLALYAACMTPGVQAFLSISHTWDTIRRLSSVESEMLRNQTLWDQEIRLVWCVMQRAMSHNGAIYAGEEIMGGFSDEETRELQRFRTDVMDEFAEMDALLDVLKQQDYDGLAKTPVQSRLLGYLTMSPEEFQCEHLFRFSSPAN
jgi:hypothetical protein